MLFIILCISSCFLLFLLFLRFLSLAVVCLFFFFKQKTAYEMRISDWSSDVCSSDLERAVEIANGGPRDLATLAIDPPDCAPDRLLEFGVSGNLGSALRRNLQVGDLAAPCRIHVEESFDRLHPLN